MKIVLAPDSFKGSLGATQACAAMERGARRVFPNAQIVSVPLADGGEGTLEALLLATGGIRKTVTVRGPLDAPTSADFAILPDGRAIIETAQAAGLHLCPEDARNALAASTFGVGQLILAALDAGCREFLIGLGGSATTDGGSGALAALDARFFDANGVVLPLGGAALQGLARIDLKFLDARLKKAQFTLLCDVTNPLHGENGAAHVYAPQKGASPAQVEILDNALRNFADVSAPFLGFDQRHEAGAGAAGGLGFGLMAFLEAQTQSGIQAVLEATNFAEVVQNADWIFTGEGALDSQTLSGKTIAGVCQIGRNSGAKIVGFGGKVALSGAQMNELGLSSAFSICDAPRELSYCLENAAPLLENAVERVLRLA